MLRDDDVVLIISNAPDLLLAKRIAHVLVEDGLAACVNLGAPGLSIYMWQGEVEGAEEVPIHIKTTYARHAAVVAALAQMHPYDVPEIIVLPVIGGAAPWTGCANRRPSCRTRETDVAICRYGWRPRLRPSRTDLARRLFALLALALLWLGWNATSRAEAEFLDPEKAFVFSAAMSAPDSVELRYRVAPGYHVPRALRHHHQSIRRGHAGRGRLSERRGEVRPHVREGHGGLPPGRDRARAGATRRPGLHADGHLARLRRRWPVLSADGPQREADPVQGGYAVAGGALAGAGAAASAGASAGGLGGLLSAGDTGLADALGGLGWAKTAGVFLVLGLLLAFTPCVLPMIPILSSIVVGGAGAKPARGRGLGLAATYVLGMSVVYTALGVAAGLSGAGLAAWLQTPWILSLFAALLAVLALAMFDVFTFQMPSGIQARCRALVAHSGGRYTGALLMGALSALIVGPAWPRRWQARCCTSRRPATWCWAVPPCLRWPGAWACRC